MRHPQIHLMHVTREQYNDVLSQPLNGAPVGLWLATPAEYAVYHFKRQTTPAALYPRYVPESAMSQNGAPRVRLAELMPFSPLV